MNQSPRTAIVKLLKKRVGPVWFVKNKFSGPLLRGFKKGESDGRKMTLPNVQDYILAPDPAAVETVLERKQVSQRGASVWHPVLRWLRP